jgi:hypothetical protein
MRFLRAHRALSRLRLFVPALSGDADATLALLV